ncbi:LamG domain-containing protein [Aeoliella sp. ICT_H6.2]|uniref:LamG domain-containing protein n=1 Tax=Aeoliella straminimaris TaxID=2954799 RepID=A0A9X2F8B1_9BACT|nr:LamG domain-containing protein [Aeoliella straminimaris]MCO6044195.1 LamG domain-containing protein [Aeoliella straminimaris]
MLIGATNRAVAVLVNKYTFNSGSADDSIGGQDATLAGTALVGDLGRLVLSGGEPRNSYLHLPDGLATSAAQGGTSGAFSFELWAHAESNVNWAALVSFGGAQNENETYDGGNKNYVQLIAQNANNGHLRVTTHAIGNGTQGYVDASAPLSTTEDQYLAVVVDQTAGTPGTISMYLNGGLVGQSSIASGLNVSTMLDNDNWLGRSQYRDDSFHGSFDEFRVYNHALSSREVTSNYSTGPEPTPSIAETPVLLVNRQLGTLTLRGAQTNEQVVGYTIESEYGALNPEAWQHVSGMFDDSPTGNGVFDSDNAWTIISATDSHTQFTEFELEGGNGGLLAAGGNLQLGLSGTWIRTPVEDLRMELKLDDGRELEIPVLYTGNNGVPLTRSDLNFDGVVSPADWPIFRDNFRVDLSPLSIAEAYGRGDLDGDGDNDYADFLIFQQDFDLNNGAGAFAGMLTAAVPEPSTGLALSLLTIVGIVAHRFHRRPVLSIAPLLFIVVAVGSTAQAVLVHQYTFNDGDVRDYVGTADGVLVDPGATTGVFTADGLLDLSGNNGQTSSGFTNDAYVDLPNGIISSLGNTGSFEMWVTVSTNRDWAEIFSFGAPSSGVENESSGGGREGYITLIPDTGNAANTLSVHHQAPSAEQYQLDAPTGQVLSPGTEHHLVSVVDKSDTSSGAGGSASLYLDGQLVNSGGLPTSFSLSALNDVNNWLGRSQWGSDPLFDGLYDEFRIYDHALSQQEVVANYANGPERNEVLTLLVNTATGQANIRNDSPTAVNFNYYEIESPAGALDWQSWSSLSDQELDSLGSSEGQSWDEGGVPTSQLVTELFLTGGTELGPGEEIGLGSVFDTSVFGPGNNGDLMFAFAKPLAATRSTEVVYYYDPALPGDFNDDGVVNLADYVVWRNSLGSATELPNDGGLEGSVSTAHYALWKSNFGSAIEAPEAVDTQAVPEPATLITLLLLLSAAFARSCPSVGHRQV